MKLAADRLKADLQASLRPLYAIHGDEILLVQEAADAVRAAARAAGHALRTLFLVEGARFDWSQVLAASHSPGLFAERQLLELRIPSGKPGKRGSEVLQQLAQECAGNDAVVILVLLPKLDRRTRSGAWFSALEAAGASVQIDSVERARLPHWIAQRLAAQGQRVAGGEEGRRTLQFFADRVEGNLLAAHQEIQKLALLYPQGELSWQQVESSVLDVARYDVFQLSEAALAGRHLRVRRMIDGLQAEGVSPVLVHWALAEDIRVLKRVRDAVADGEPIPMAMRRNRVWGQRERQVERVVPRLAGRDASRLLRAAHQADAVVKGLHVPGWPGEPWQALQRLGQRLCAACAVPR